MPGGINLGNAYGVVSIETSDAHKNILGLQKGVGGLQGGLLGLNPVLAATGLALGGATAAAGGLTAAIGYSVGNSADLQEQLSGVKAVTGATNEEVADLRDLIDDLSLDPGLKVTAFEAADAIELLGRNGLEVEQIMNGAAEATVLLANATGAEFGPAADVATDTMAIFKIEAENMIDAVDGITAVVNNSKFGFDDFRLALAQGGGVAGAAGVEFEDFTTAIAGIAPLFASGSDAGTSFKTFLQKLIPTSSKASDVMQELGIVTEDGQNRFFDANGQLKDMADISKILNGALANLSEEQRNNALSTIFGTDAMRAAVGLMDLGAVSADGMTTGFEELQAAMGKTSAAENAATRMDNLSGSIEILRGVVDSITLGIGDKFLPVATDAVQRFTEFLKANADAIIEFFGYLADGVVYVEDFAEQLFTLFDEGGLAGVSDAFWSWIGDVTAQGPGLLNSILDVINDFLLNQWPAISQTLDTWGDRFFDWVSTVAIPRAYEELGKLGTSMQTWAESPDGSQRLQTLGFALSTALLDGMATALGNTDRIFGILGALVSGTFSALPSVTDGLLSVGAAIAGGVFSGIYTYITGDEPSQQTVQLFSDMWRNTMKTLVSTVVPAVGLSFAVGQFNSIRDELGKLDFISLGRGIVEGIAKGIIDGAGAVVDAARNAAESALETARSWLDAHSPSQRAANEIGLPFSEGVAMGIGKGADAVTRAAMESIQRPFDSLANTAPTAGAGVTNNSSTIAPVFNITGDNAREIGDEIERRLERLFDNAQGGSFAYG